MLPAVRITSAAVGFSLVGLMTAGPAAQEAFSTWSEPVNLGNVVNSSFLDAGPAISKDGLSLYFNSNRPGGFGNVDIWVCQRPSPDAPWGWPTNLGGLINTAASEGTPAFSRDEHWMFFNSNRSGGIGANDIWASYRQHTHDDFGWDAPINLGAPVNTSFADQAASYFENDDIGTPLLFFTSNRPGGIGSYDTYVSQILSDGSPGPATVVAELSTTAFESRPSVRFDGLEVFFFSTRAVSAGGYDLWGAVRETVFDAWSTPANLGPLVNSAADDQQPYIAADQRTLYFASNRPGGVGDVDLYVTTRTKVHGG